MRILITGGAGFIGFHLAEKLVKEGCSVCVIDNLATGRLENIAHLWTKYNDFDFLKDSVLNRGVLEKVIPECDIIYHLAAISNSNLANSNPELAIDVNIGGFRNVLEIANRNMETEIVFVSTIATGGFDLGSDIYLGTKRIGELLGLWYYEKYGLSVSIARLSNVIGPGQLPDYGAVVPTFVKAAILNKPIIVHGTGKQTKRFIDVSVVVEGLMSLSPGCIQNLKGENDISILNLAGRIKAITESESKIVLECGKVATLEACESDTFLDGSLSQVVSYMRK